MCLKRDASSFLEGFRRLSFNKYDRRIEEPKHNLFTRLSRIEQEIKVNQPKKPAFSYPYINFGKEERSSLSAWYENQTWLHYDEAEDYVLCINSKNASDQGILNNVKVVSGKNTRSADKRFQKRTSLKCHHTASCIS